jgi:transposase
MRSSADTENLVTTLHQRGWSYRRISREIGVSRNTVRAIVERVARARAEGHTALPRRVIRKSQLDDHDTFITELVERHPDISAVRLLEELRGNGFVGSYTIVREHLRAIRPMPKAKPVERFETAPGAQGQQDWSPYTIDFTEEGRRQVQCFSFILGYSRRHFIHFGEGLDFFALIREHVRAAEHLGGMPAEVLYDGQATIRLRWEAGVPIYQPSFLAFATHYGFRPRVLPPRRPELKGKVERPFQYVEGNCLNARDFRNLAHLNEHAAWWMAHVSDVHPHKTTKQRPIDRFEAERDRLSPLPTRPYDTAEVGYRVVSDECFVSWEGTRYAVPPAYVLDLVVVRATEDEVFVYSAEISLIARHRRLRNHAEPVGTAEYHPRRRTRRDPEALVARLAELGDVAATFAVGVTRKQRYHGQHLAQVLALREQYAADDLVAALERAVRYRAFDAAIVTRIIETQAQPRSLPETLADEARRRLRDGLPKPQVLPRELDVYGAAMRGESED